MTRSEFSSKNRNQPSVAQIIGGRLTTSHVTAATETAMSAARKRR